MHFLQKENMVMFTNQLGFVICNHRYLPAFVDLRLGVLLLKNWEVAYSRGYFSSWITAAKVVFRKKQVSNEQACFNFFITGFLKMNENLVILLSLSALFNTLRAFLQRFEFTSSIFHVSYTEDIDEWYKVSQTSV